MIKMIVDANIFKSLYEEDIGLPTPRPERTGKALNIVENSVHRTKKIFLDNKGQIEAEWRNQCLDGIEWFEAWISANLASGFLTFIEVDNHIHTIKKLKQLGFPKGKDSWYLKVSLTATSHQINSGSYLITEDIDFYDPSKKKAPNKIKTIKSGKGPVASHLSKSNVKVCCIEEFSQINF